ncbi:hypothetical protein V2J09_000574, partial [Rumex salicifolius]
KLKLGVQPTIRDTFEKCYRKKDGTVEPTTIKYLVREVDVLVKKATQEATANGSTIDVDENTLWIEATGGVKKK